MSCHAGLRRGSSRFLANDDRIHHGSILAGLPFTALNYLAMTSARVMYPTRFGPIVGLLTAGFAIGQILGPPMVLVNMGHVSDVRSGFNLSLEVAGGSLIIAAVIYVYLQWRAPK